MPILPEKAFYLVVLVGQGKNLFAIIEFEYYLLKKPQVKEFRNDLTKISKKHFRQILEKEVV